MKACTRCGVIKDFTHFPKKSQSSDGLSSHCKTCRSETDRAWRSRNVDRVRSNKDRWYSENKAHKKAYDQLYYARNAHKYKQRALERERELKTRQFGDPVEINEIYKTCPEGYHVDHIVPLKGVNSKGEHVVCGLHAPWNLQHLPAEENLRKSNKFEENE